MNKKTNGRKEKNSNRCSVRIIFVLSGFRGVQASQSSVLVITSTTSTASMLKKYWCFL
jgi:hypothetical protein